MKRKIVAIGGGKVMVPPRREPQTLSIDKAIVRLSSKHKPKLLFVPTASEDNLEYCEAIKRLYQNRLGCQVDNLLLYRDRPSQREMKFRIINSDIIYVGGGNTLRMMKLWRKLGIDRYFDQARKRGTVLCGLSAGSICWFRQGNSDSRKFKDGTNDTLIKVTGLDYVDIIACPHYDVEKHRQPSLKKMMKRTKGVAIALENRSAIEIVDDKYRALFSGTHKNVWRIYWHKGEYYKEKLPKDGRYRSLQELVSIP